MSPGTAARSCSLLRDIAVSASIIAGLPGLTAPVSIEAGRVELRTRTLQTTLAELLRRAEREGTTLERLDARSATLEQAFLSIANAGQPASVAA